MPADPSTPAAVPPPNHHLRFHAPHRHLAPAFGSDWFGQKAERFARFFGTPAFIITQTFIVSVWTRITRELTQSVEALTREIHTRTCSAGQA